MQVVNHYSLRHYLKKISQLLFLKYYTLRKPYIRQVMEGAWSKYIHPVIFPGEDNGIIYIYQRNIFLLYIMPCKEEIPREEGFLGGIILQKIRLGNLLGEMS